MKGLGSGRIAGCLEAFKRAVQTREKRKFSFVKEVQPTGGEFFCGFNQEAHDIVNIFNMSCAGRAARDGGFGRDGHADDGNFGGKSGLHNGIHVIEPVAVRRDVLLRERERRREFPGGYAHQ